MHEQVSQGSTITTAGVEEYH